jgi:hypothetical protein
MSSSGPANSERQRSFRRSHCLPQMARRGPATLDGTEDWSQRMLEAPSLLDEIEHGLGHSGPGRESAGMARLFDPCGAVDPDAWLRADPAARVNRHVDWTVGIGVAVRDSPQPCRRLVAGCCPVPCVQDRRPHARLERQGARERGVDARQHPLPAPRQEAGLDGTVAQPEPVRLPARKHEALPLEQFLERVIPGRGRVHGADGEA